MKHRSIALLLVLILIAPFARAADLALKPNDTVAVCGDSITEQKEYSVFIEDYLLMCQPAASIRAAQFGWGGETSWGFLGRMANDVLWLKPSVATTCYGMNDGGYGPLNPDRAKQYKNAQRGIVQLFKGANTRVIIVGSPGCVDADTSFRGNAEQAAVYNKTLASLRDIAQETARQEGVLFANVYDPMIDAMTKAKAKYGKQYHLAGGDGVHPAKNGQLVMAYAYLKAMGCDGNIGTFTVDLKANATASEGHKILSSQNGSLELESSRYPFCFFGNPSDPNATTGVIEFLPFNDDLNRLTLIVKNANADRLKITWGNTTKEFPASALEKGINLAAEFLDNPFCDQFKKVEQTIRTQQNYETPLHKQLLHDLPMYQNAVPEESESIARIAAAVQKKDAALAAASSAAVTPVKHTIKIEPVK